METQGLNSYLWFLVLIILSIFLCSSCVPKSEWYDAQPKASKSHRVGWSPDGPSDMPPGEPGKCYAKCKILADAQVIKIHYAEYTGEDTGVDFVEKQVIFERANAGTKWVKKKAKKNCLSNNPEDCMVWCLVEVPPFKLEKYVVTDTSQLKEFEMKTYDDSENYTYADSYEWREVVCEPQINESLLNKICNSLIVENYMAADECDNKNRIKSAIRAYQTEKLLPVGGLNIETLNHLGVDF